MILSRRLFMAGSAAALAPLEMAWAAPPAQSAADRQFEALGKRYLEEGLKLSPIAATSIGDHRWDHEIGDFTPAGFRASADFSRRILADLERIPKAQLSRANQVDAAILENQLKGDIWSTETLQNWKWDPLVYSGSAGGALNSLFARDFAPLPDRLRAATSRMEKLPALLAAARANLEPARVPSIHATTVANQNKGLHSLIDGLVQQAPALPEADRGRLTAA
ncbi:MAG TPA: DUF885 family protein, partial [Alphaproteobacteria bacterium]|nr:DUF885 family protein [Alphaproteobacteria bacterium]